LTAPAFGAGLPTIAEREPKEITVRRIDLAIGIGGAAGQGIATPGDILARIFVRRGLHVNAYNAYQSIIRGGHIFLTLRTSDEPVLSQGDKFDVLVPLNQDTMNRHLRLMRPGSAVLFNSDTIKPFLTAQPACFPSRRWRPPSGRPVQNTVALAAAALDQGRVETLKRSDVC
jgi:Pyruvate/2-oxoacid:ferredoxin oxidoreductase gamma subunit